MLVLICSLLRSRRSRFPVTWTPRRSSKNRSPYLALKSYWPAYLVRRDQAPLASKRITRSDGALRVTRLMLPAMASASLSGVIALKSSTPARFPCENVLMSTPRASASVGGMRTPSIVNVVNLSLMPRRITLFASPPERMRETPGSRPMASAALASGSSWIFSSEITFMMVEELICWFIAAAWPRACAVTTTSFPSMTSGTRAASSVVVSPLRTVIFVSRFR